MEKWIEKNKKRIINDLGNFVKIESIQTSSKKDKPFGEGVSKALNYILEYAEDIGLETTNLDNYIGYADWGDGDEILGILCHIDIVPPGSGWETDPYTLVEKEKRYVGRGVLDDKGPTIQILNAIKYLKEKDIKPKRKVRVIFGTNEESGWGGINYYLERKPAPDISFTPDAEFPVIFAEKGILHLEFSYKQEMIPSEVIKLEGGNAPNMVPNEAVAYIKSDKNFREEKGIEITKEGSETKITAHGKSAHASLPQSGDNAISKLIMYLNKYYDNKFLKFYCDKIGETYNGEKINAGFEDKESGKLTFNTGLLNTNSFSVDIRYPVTIDENDLIRKIEENLPVEISLNIQMHKGPLYVDKESKLVKSLMGVYKEVTNENSKPIAIGGGTYARAVDNAVAFGPLFPDEEEVAHQANEYVRKESFFKSFKIYTRAIKNCIS